MMTNVVLDEQAKDDLLWVSVNIMRFNGKHVSEPSIDVYIESDASLSGWGATCLNQNSGGRWTSSESSQHINYLELLAAFFALQSFVSHRRSIHVRIQLNSSSAVAYINNMGGIKSHLLNTLSVEIWSWCIAKDIWLSAQHIPGVQNARADFQSRVFSDDLEWSLHPSIFERIVGFTYTPDVDLFASRLNHKVHSYVSWHPDPGAVATDAFAISWSNQKCYAFPPFSLIPRVLSKIQRDKTSVLLIAPVWPTQGWYPTLLQLLVEQPILLPRWNNLLVLPHNKQLHPHRNKLLLAAWTVSGDPLQAEVFLNKQSTMCASWTSGTEKQYRAVWKKWTGWCDQRDINTLQASVEEVHVTNFLADCFQEGKIYSTLNTYRSALSSTLCPCKNDTVGSHPLVSRLLKGVFHLRPSQPRYSSTWDVSIVMSYLKTLFPLEQLTLKLLTLKTVMLCALASAQRAQTLCALDLNCISYCENSVNFVVTERLKTSRPGGPTVNISVPVISNEASICPKTCLTEYISRTSSLRGSNNQCTSKVFIS